MLACKFLLYQIDFCVKFNGQKILGSHKIMARKVNRLRFADLSGLGHVRTCATFSIIAGYATVIITWWQRQSHSILLHISYQSHASPTPFTLHHAPFSYQTLDSLMTVSGLLLGAILSHFCDCQEYGVRMVGVWRENGRRP